MAKDQKENQEVAETSTPEPAVRVDPTAEQIRRIEEKCSKTGAVTMQEAATLAALRAKQKGL